MNNGLMSTTDKNSLLVATWMQNVDPFGWDFNDRNQHHEQHYVHLPLTTRQMFIQPGQRNRNRRTRPQINYEGSPGSCSLEMSFLSTNTTSVATTTNSSSVSASSETFALSHSPERTNGIFLERERRLRLIRMEIEDLTFQLSSLSEDRSNSENNAGGFSISSSDLEGLVFEPDLNSEDDDDEDGALTTNSYCSFRYEDELPSYDESIIIIEEQMEESPPPSYAQCTTHLNLNLLHYSTEDKETSS